MTKYGNSRWFLVLMAVLISLGINFSSSRLSAETLAYWQAANRHSFCSNFQAGSEANGHPLFISQAQPTPYSYTENIEILPSGLPNGVYTSGEQGFHIGKAGTHLTDGMTYSYGGREYEANTGVFAQMYGHLVFCLTKLGEQRRDELHWVQMSNGGFPPNSIKGFNTAEGQIVCRTNWGGGIHPGKLIPSAGACYIGYGGRERSRTTYEVLAFVSEAAETEHPEDPMAILGYRCDVPINYSNLTYTCDIPPQPVGERCLCSTNGIPSFVK